MYLRVKSAGKYWRFDYRFNGSRKTTAFGTYPEVSLAKARQRLQEARALLADGVDPSSAKRAKRQEKILLEQQTFESIARQWLVKTAVLRAQTTQVKVESWLARNIFPQIGSMAISQINPRDVLLTVQRMEARGAIESAHRVKQLCGQVFRYAVALGLAERDVTQDLRCRAQSSYAGASKSQRLPCGHHSLLRRLFHTRIATRQAPRHLPLAPRKAARASTEILGSLTGYNF